MTARISFPLLGWALKYAGKRWPVFPCEPRGKKPLTEHGLKDATTDPEKIRAWWTRWPDANIGTPTGERIVLDVDGPEGEAALAALEKEHGKLPETLTAKTGREHGRHFYFQGNGVPIRNSAGRLGPHLDIRGVGGYVILPPSVHVSGARYEWLTHGVRPASMPECFFALLAEPVRKQSGANGAGGKIPQGQRNAYLTSVAGSMRRPGMSPVAIEAALLKENLERCNPPLGEGEVCCIAASIARYEPATPGAKSSSEVISLAKMRAFSSIDPEPLRWLWPGRIPLGKLTLIAGDPGLGKSMLSVDIAARVSTGANFPDGAPCEQGHVIFLSAEDDAADTIRPRLDAAGADVSRVHWLEAVRNVAVDGKSVESTFNLERDIGALEDALRQTGAQLIGIDPISAYLGGTDSHANADVRGLLAPLSALATKYKAAIVAVTHLRKSAGAAIYRTMGSLAFAAAARSVWGVIADPDDKTLRLLLPVKQNLAPDGGGLAYRIEAQNGVGRIAWVPGSVAVDVNAVMGGFESREEHSQRREAEDWLRDYLTDGPQPASEIKSAAKRVGIKETTLWRAADSLQVQKRKLGGRGAGWEWSLKESTPIHSEVDSLNIPLKTKDVAQSKNSKNPSMEYVETGTFEEGQI